VGLAVSAGPKLAGERPAWFVVGGLWGVGVLCAAGALVGLELARTRLNGSTRVLVRSAGYGAGLILVIRAASVELLLLTSPALSDTVGPAQKLWTLALWNPWFAVGGVAFLVASHGYETKRAAGSAPNHSNA
jgi:hypothetical protein